jgi:hypothetical protein
MSRMVDFEAIAEKVIDAMTNHDSRALKGASEKFLDVFSIHYTSAEWTRFAVTDGGFACLLGFELSHLHLGSDVGMTRLILESVDPSLWSSEQASALRNRWNLIGLPIGVGNIENEWKTCLVAIASELGSPGDCRGLSSEFEQALFDRAGIVTFSLLKKLMNQISQSEALIGAVLTIEDVSIEAQTLLVRWMFSEPNIPFVPQGYQDYIGPSGVCGSSPK